MPFRVLFVCSGNICRSPMAEGMFRHLVAQAGREADYEIESAGTGPWHVGQPPDSRMAQTARRHGVRLAGRARQFRPADFDRFDLVLAMDSANHISLVRAARSAEDERKIHLMREFDPQAAGDLDVPDPWYGGQAGFDEVYRIIERSSRALLAQLERAAQDA